MNTALDNTDDEIVNTALDNTDDEMDNVHDRC